MVSGKHYIKESLFFIFKPEFKEPVNKIYKNWKFISYCPIFFHPSKNCWINYFVDFLNWFVHSLSIQLYCLFQTLLNLIMDVPLWVFKFPSQLLESSRHFFFFMHRWNVHNFHHNFLHRVHLFLLLLSNFTVDDYMRC